MITLLSFNSIPGTIPGGWFATINSYGTIVRAAHEAQVYSSNDTITNFFPLSEVLTGNTPERTEDVIVKNADVIISDAGTLVLPSFGTNLVNIQC